MKKLLTSALVTILSASTVLGLASNASAGTYSPRIDQREANQQNRINQGIRSGALTPLETYRLQKREASIKAQESRFEADGHLSQRERRILNNRLDRTSKAIYRAKHNGRHW